MSGSAAICTALDGVPLAIELAAAQAAAFTLPEILARVRSDAVSLARVGRRGQHHHASLRDAIEVSSSLLSEEELQAHHAIAVVPGTLTSELAAALTDTTIEQTAVSLSRLVHRSMLTAPGPLAPGRPSQFLQLATIRSHGLNGPAGPQEEFETRRNAWVQRLADGMPDVRDAGVEWPYRVDDDLAAIRASLQHQLADRPTASGVSLAARLGEYWYTRGMIAEWERWTRLAAEQEPAGASLEHLLVRLSHATAVALSGQGQLLDEAIDAIDERAPAFDQPAQARIAFDVLTFGTAAWASGDAAVAVKAERVGRAAAEASGDPDLLLPADSARLVIDIAGGTDLTTALLRAQQLWDRAEGLNRRLSWTISGWGSLAAILVGDATAARLWTGRMVSRHVQVGIGTGGASATLEMYGAGLALAGDVDRAVEVLAASRSYARRSGMVWPLAVTTPSTLELLEATLDPADRERAERAGAHLSFDDLTRTLIAGDDRKPRA